MSDDHLTRELLRGVERGERTPGDLVSLVMHHLFELCPVCKSEFEAFDEESQWKGWKVADYEELFEKVGSRASMEAVILEEERAQAALDLPDLLGLSPEGRERFLALRPRRFASPSLASLLLEQSLERMPGLPREALDLARLAKRVLLDTRASMVATEVYLRARAHEGNALRALGRLEEADEALRDARFFLRGEGGGDRRVRAELDSFEGSLRRAQRRFDDAEKLLERALTAYRFEQDGPQQALTLIKLGYVYREQGRIERAMVATREALELVDAARHPRLYLYAHQNLAHWLCDAGQFEEAQRTLAAALPLYHQAPEPLTQLRALWLEGLIAQGLREVATAERCLVAARGGFLEAELPYDVALVSLDLAALYLEERRTAEVKAIAEEIVPTFERLEVHREAQAAVMLFREAARLEQITLELLRQLHRYLEAARCNPALAFQRPS